MTSTVITADQAVIDVTVSATTVTAEPSSTQVIEASVTSGCNTAVIDVASVVRADVVQSPAVNVAAVSGSVIEVIASPVSTCCDVSADLVDLTARDSVNQDLIYIGRSRTDAKDQAASEWQIYRYDSEADSFVALFADGNTAFDNIWNDRESLTY